MGTHIPPAQFGGRIGSWWILNRKKRSLRLLKNTARDEEAYNSETNWALVVWSWFPLKKLSGKDSTFL